MCLYLLLIVYVQLKFVRFLIRHATNTVSIDTFENKNSSMQVWDDKIGEVNGEPPDAIGTHVLGRDSIGEAARPIAA